MLHEVDELKTMRLAGIQEILRLEKCDMALNVHMVAMAPRTE